MEVSSQPVFEWDAGAISKISRWVDVGQRLYLLFAFVTGYNDPDPNQVGLPAAGFLFSQWMENDDLWISRQALMRLSVLYFATLRQRVGIRQEKLELAMGSRVSDLLTMLQKRHTSLEDALPTTLVSINREYASRDELLHDGDEVALFPPVSGGATSPKSTLFRLTNDALDIEQILADLDASQIKAACVCSGRAIGDTISDTEVDRVADEIRERWPAVRGVAVVRRAGGEIETPNVLIACTSDQGSVEVLYAAQFGIERLIRSILTDGNEDIHMV
ncbi:MAG: MoaD/ThiS family protein [Anaerolineales bacterium]|jgi:molybdopterin converting factor subunit 1